MKENERKLRILCLHGFRTSGKILFMQTAAMRYHIHVAEYTFIDAPFEAIGPPDRGVCMCYPEQEYYEWLRLVSVESHPSQEAERQRSKDKTIQYLVDYMNRNGPFDGLLGFSQGAAVASGLAMLQANCDERLDGVPMFKFLILIGGVPPTSFINHSLQNPDQQQASLQIPSLHIMGKADQLNPRSRELVQMFSEYYRTVLEHEEGHNIPSLRTGLYPKMLDWLCSLT